MMSGSNINNPLVTFALFHYNQEKLVAGAMRAALAQDYSPLEIIVSDDCSTDGTWDVIKEVAAGYSGPHQLRINRNDLNMGIGPHVGKVGLMARGELVVQADGDDISMCSRVSELVAAWLAKEKPEGLLYSNARVQGENGQYREDEDSKRDLQNLDLQNFVGNKFRGQFFGATAAYTKSVFSRFPPLSAGFEDVALNFRALLIGRVVYVDKILVDYNFSTDSVSSPLRIWERARGRRWFNSLYKNLEAMEQDYAHYVQMEGLVPDEFIVKQLTSVKRRLSYSRGLMSFNPIRFIPGMLMYPYGVSFRQWFGFHRFFLGLR